MNRKETTSTVSWVLSVISSPHPTFFFFQTFCVCIQTMEVNLETRTQRISGKDTIKFVPGAPRNPFTQDNVEWKTVLLKSTLQTL